jgi:hypothetical protein
VEPTTTKPSPPAALPTDAPTDPFDSGGDPTVP